MTVLEYSAEFDGIVDEILRSPSGQVDMQRDKIDQRLEWVAQLAIWDAENSSIFRGDE